MWAFFGTQCRRAAACDKLRGWRSTDALRSAFSLMHCGRWWSPRSSRTPSPSFLASIVDAERRRYRQAAVPADRPGSIDSPTWPYFLQPPRSSHQYPHWLSRNGNQLRAALIINAVSSQWKSHSAAEADSDTPSSFNNATQLRIHSISVIRLTNAALAGHPALRWPLYAFLFSQWLYVISWWVNGSVSWCNSSLCRHDSYWLSPTRCIKTSNFLH